MQNKPARWASESAERLSGASSALHCVSELATAEAVNAALPGVSVDEWVTATVGPHCRKSDKSREAVSVSLTVPLAFVTVSCPL